MNYQQLIFALEQFWAQRGCVVLQPYDCPVGAGTMCPATFLWALGPEPAHVAYVQPSRRPSDGRYGENPNRFQKHLQLQVILKPSPPDVQDLYLDSLQAIGLDLHAHDVKFVEDDWEAPTLGASGLGWEVRLDGMEITQFTYFQQVGGIDLAPISVELTYGLERLCMYLQGKESVYDLTWNDTVTYGQVHHQGEVEHSTYNFDQSDAAMLFTLFAAYEKECKRLCAEGLPWPAYDFCLKCSHAFNLLDARGAISITERMGYILRVRTLASAVARLYAEQREKLGYPMLPTEAAHA